MDAKELLSMFKMEFEKNITLFHEVKERIVESRSQEDLALALQTYALMLQRICDGAAALGLNGVYLYLQTICLNVYEAKTLSPQDQALISEMYVFWIESLTTYLDAAISGDDERISTQTLHMLEEFTPPKVLLEVDETALVEMMQSLQQVMDVDSNVQHLLDEVSKDREDVFLFDEQSFEMDWANLNTFALSGLLTECQDNIECVERSLLACEDICSKVLSHSTVDADKLSSVIDEAKRAAHTIKGSSQMGGLPRLSLLMHKIEDLFDFASTPNFSWKIFCRPALMLWTKRVVEEAGKLTEALADEGFEPSARVSKKRLRNFLDCLAAAMNGSDDPEGLQDDPQPSQCGDVKLGSARTGSEGEPRDVAPSREREISSQMLTSLFEGISNSRIRVNHIKTQGVMLGHTLKAAKRESEELGKKLEDMARFVSTHLLDAGGLDSLEKRNYSEVYTMCVSIGETNNNMKILLGEVDGSSLKIREQIESVEKNERGLSQEVLRAQMVDFASVSGRLKRVVSSAAEACMKEVSYSMKGAGTLIEKGVLDKLRDPLMHLLRNAIDHGMSDRHGGQLMLVAESYGNKVRVLIEDDGAGVDLLAVKATAVNKGLLSQAEADRMTNDELRGLIFEHGFSTKTSVSEMSGRGVGLDVVKKNVEELGGSVVAREREGGGTVFELLIPSNMSSVNCLVIRHAGGYYAVPTSFITKILEPGGFLLTKLEGGQSVRAEIDEAWAHVQWQKNSASALAPAMDFKKFTKLSGTVAPSKLRHQPGLAGYGGGMKALMLKFGRSELAVLVEETLFIEDLVVRKANALGRASKYVLGTTILLNGNIVPILNVGELMAAKGLEQEATPLKAEPLDAAIKILVVDDSLFMRNFLEQELESMGYEPILAINGLEAVRKLRESTVAMVLTDLEMPEMDGLELTKYIKGHQAHRTLPVFLITSRSTDRYRQLAQEAGVDCFISKPFEVKHLETQMAAALHQQVRQERS